MCVGIQGKSDAGVAQPLTNHLGIDTVIQQVGGVGMPEVMKTDMGHFRLPEDTTERVAHSAGIEGLTVGMTEDEIILGWLAAKQKVLDLLVTPVPQQQIN